ncbi:Cofilin tropomyosin-type actin-binding protein [Rutstroemia sp. NJR-2017a BBW]|nr:Cofilin tropomyosin-type actin-binding protein [Rutstroemia sp. NJR-2017a BBW]
MSTSPTETNPTTRKPSPPRSNASRRSTADTPEINEAYELVRSDKSPINYLLISYAAATGNELTLTCTGEGGLAELREKLDPTQAQYAYCRVEYANDTESKRTKVMRKARVSIESGAVKQVLSHISVTVDATSKGDLNEEEIVKLCRKAGGADYNGGRG